jgi:hypothetical protein
MALVQFDCANLQQLNVTHGDQLELDIGSLTTVLTPARDLVEHIARFQPPQLALEMRRSLVQAPMIVVE